jgi:hypothetical protein
MTWLLLPSCQQFSTGGGLSEAFRVVITVEGWGAEEEEGEMLAFSEYRPGYYETSYNAWGSPHNKELSSDPSTEPKLRNLLYITLLEECPVFKVNFLCFAAH